MSDKRGALAERLKQARKSLGLTQKQLSERSSIPLPSYKDYEAGKRVPGGEALESLLKMGISANWLLGAAGPMLVEPAEDHLAPADAL